MTWWTSKSSRPFFYLLKWLFSRTTDTWWLDLKFFTVQIYITIPNRKSCFLQKKWLSNAKSQTKDTRVTKFEPKFVPKIPYIGPVCFKFFLFRHQMECPRRTLPIPHKLFSRSVQSGKYLGYLKKISHWLWLFWSTPF